MEPRNVFCPDTGQCFVEPQLQLKSLIDKLLAANERDKKVPVKISAPVNPVNSLIAGLEVSKKKRTRRRRRSNKRTTEKSPIENDVNCSENPLLAFLNTFKITAVKGQTTSKVFRIKNGTSCKHINTKFLLSILNTTTLHAVPSTSSCILRNDSICGSYDKFKTGTINTHTETLSVDELTLQSSIIDVQCARSSSSSPKENQKVNVQKKRKQFVPHLSPLVAEIGIQMGQLIKGVLRINSKNFHEAYISNEDSLEQDYLIPSIVDRNRALEGDVVAIKIKEKEEWTEKQKTAFVVSIVEKVHSRMAIGLLQLLPDKSRRFAVFIPRDHRVPKIHVPIDQCPSSFYQHPNRFENILFRARIVTWNDVKHAVGKIIDNVGVVGDLESETNALLVETSLDVTPIPSEFLRFTRITNTIPNEEFLYRKDLRKECIFTIDPLTARDLDDAVSCRELDNGNLEIGVHISDVAYYLPENTVLDKLVCKKATTIYLVNNVYHMLPQELCMHCSLLPGCDRLAFSVIWEMTKTGEILRHYFTRSVINSCVKLAYEHAQKMIENPNYEFTKDEIPEIHGGFNYKDLSKIINYLQNIAVNLRTQRFERGSLRIDQTKLLFKLDATTEEPIECFVYENTDSHRLIEEFMLLANISVAQKIVQDFPELAFLRRHEPPNARLIKDLVKKLEEFDFKIDVSSSKAIQTSLFNMAQKQNFGEPQLAVLNYLLAKPMKRAAYFCAANTDSEDDFQHYALHVPIYTHFTSPIRRYADVMVHRLLAAALGYSTKPTWSVEYVTAVANNCNKQKYNAKIAGEASSDLYLAHYIGEHQPFIRDAIVVEVRTTFFDVLVVATGTIHRLYFNGLDYIDCVVTQEENTKKVIIIFSKTPETPEERYVIQLFSMVKVSLFRKPKAYKLEVKLLRPARSHGFEKM